MADAQVENKGGKAGRSGNWTISNVITFIRICLVPVFVIAMLSPWPDWIGFSELNPWKMWIAAGIFVLISGTDWLDGYLARKRNEVTDLGKFMDPLADKILVIAALLVLIELDALPSWVVLVIVAREFIVSGLRMVAATKGEVIAASYLGKTKTVFQMIAIVLFVIKQSGTIGANDPTVYWHFYVFCWVIMGIAVLLTILSMIDYLVKAKDILAYREAEVPELEQAQDVEDDADSLARAVLAGADAHDLKVGCAESCTGGLIAATITGVPGASKHFAGGIVSYAESVKNARLDVSWDVLKQYGAVSEQTACQMARGACQALDVDVAVSVTGIAGPGGAEPGKPVGTVWIGISSGRATYAKQFLFDGGRDDVRRQTVETALAMLLSEIDQLSAAS